MKRALQLRLSLLSKTYGAKRVVSGVTLLIYTPMHPVLFLIAILPSLEVCLASCRHTEIGDKWVSLITRVAIMRSRTLSIRRSLKQYEGCSK